MLAKKHCCGASISSCPRSRLCTGARCCTNGSNLHSCWKALSECRSHPGHCTHFLSDGGMRHHLGQARHFLALLQFFTFVRAAMYECIAAVAYGPIVFSVWVMDAHLSVATMPFCQCVCVCFSRAYLCEYTYSGDQMSLRIFYCLAALDKLDST